MFKSAIILNYFSKMDAEFVRATSEKLPSIEMYSLLKFINTTENFIGIEIRGVKAKRKAIF